MKELAVPKSMFVAPHISEKFHNLGDAARELEILGPGQIATFADYERVENAIVLLNWFGYGSQKGSDMYELHQKGLRELIKAQNKLFKLASGPSWPNDVQG